VKHSITHERRKTRWYRPLSSACSSCSHLRLSALVFLPAAGGAVQNQCVAGTYSTVTGAQAISACNSCPVGYYCLGGSQQTRCAAGTWSTITGATTWDDCKPCTAGSYCSGGSNIQTCPSGNYCPASSNGPIGCPTGTTSAAGAKSLAECSTVKCTYSLPGNFTTAICVSFFSLSVKLTRLFLDCVASLLSHRAANSAQGSCIPGTQYDYNQVCTATCNPGYVSNGGSSTCQQGGSFNSGQYCNQCPSGFWCRKCTVTHCSYCKGLCRTRAHLSICVSACLSLRFFFFKLAVPSRTSANRGRTPRRGEQ
jgi:hypothetical protein